MSDYSSVRAKLEEQLEQLVARAEGINEDLSDAGDEDWEERAKETEDDEVLATMGNLTLKEIDQIKHALHEIDHGTYGTCSRCGCKIPAERLEVLPFATTCTGCS